MASYFGMPPPNGGILGGGIVRRGPRTKPRRGGSVGGRGITSVPFQPVPGTPRPSGGPIAMPWPNESPKKPFPGGILGGGKPSSFPGWGGSPLMAFPTDGGFGVGHGQPSQDWPNWHHEQPVFGPAQRQPATFDPNNRKDWAPGTTFADAIAGRAKTVDFPYGPERLQPTGNMQPMYPSTPYAPGPGWGGGGIMGGKLGGPTQGPSMAGPMGGGAGINPQMVMSLMRILGGGR